MPQWVVVYSDQSYKKVVFFETEEEAMQLIREIADRPLLKYVGMLSIEFYYHLVKKDGGFFNEL